MSNPELAIVVPAYNERDNIEPLFDALAQALIGVSYEVIVVDDDSPDGTAAKVWQLSATHPHTRVLQRINRRGLSSACIEGMMATSAPFIAVMDADLQHDETILPAMLSKLKAEALDLVIGSRYVDGGDIGQFSQPRILISNIGKNLSRMVCHADLSDPMSGFFIITRPFMLEVVRSLSGTGFKLLLDILATAKRPVKLGEVGYKFRSRQFGESKLDIVVVIEYAQLLIDKMLGGLIPASYLFFCAVGAVGYGLHLAMVRWLTTSIGLSFERSQWSAGFLVMIANFLLNNAVTFRAQKLRGWTLLPGLVIFCAACSVGLYLNVAVASSLLHARVWWLSASLAGLVMGSVWNYGVTSLFVWNISRRRRSNGQADLVKGGNS